MTSDPAAFREQAQAFWDPTQVPGLTAAVLQGDDRQVISLGITSVDEPLPVGPETLFQIGSISKTYTAAALMRLIDMERLSLEDTVRSHIPEFRVADPVAAEQVTVHHLLTHFAGWEGDFFIDTGAGPGALARYVTALREAKQLVPVGEHFSYNNAAFNLAGRLIELTSGMSFEQAVKALVLEPLGLERTFFEATEAITEAFAVGHHVSEAGPGVARPWQLPRASFPAGGVVSDIGDLLTYAAHQLQLAAEAARANPPSAGLALMHTPQRRIGDRQAWIGLPWFITDVSGTKMHWHQGATNGQVALLILVPEHQFAVAVLTNSSAGGALTQPLAHWALEHFLGLKEEAPTGPQPASAELARYTGRYERPFASVEITQVDEALSLDFRYLGGFPSRDDPPPPGPPPLALAPAGTDRFVIAEGAAKNNYVEFIPGEEDQIALVRVFNRLHRRVH
jgi:CubicO group peptidase (beta-lactamase class C family)